MNMAPEIPDDGVRLSWQEVVARKRGQRDQAIRPFLSVDNVELKQRPVKLDAINIRSALRDQRQNAMTDENEIEVLLERLQSRRLNAEDLVYAYIRR